MTATLTTKTASVTKKATRKKPVKVSQSNVRMLGQVIASAAACFLPIAAFVIAHHEVQEYPYMWVLVIASLAYSAPTVVAWAKSWAGATYKAVGFAVLLEGNLIGTHNMYLSYTGLVVICVINAHAAYINSGKAFKAEKKAPLKRKTSSTSVVELKAVA